MTANGKFRNDEAVIAFYDGNDDFAPIKAETARSVSFARNYLICNIIVQCFLFAFIVFFVLAENWYTIKVIALQAVGHSNWPAHSPLPRKPLLPPQIPQRARLH